MDADGLLTVSFLKEKYTAFYVTPDKEELSYPVQRHQVVMLEAPEYVAENRTFGFRFHKNIKLAIQAYFAK